MPKAKSLPRLLDAIKIPVADLKFSGDKDELAYAEVLSSYQDGEVCIFVTLDGEFRLTGNLLERLTRGREKPNAKNGRPNSKGLTAKCTFRIPVEALEYVASISDVTNRSHNEIAESAFSMLYNHLLRPVPPPV